MISLRQLLAIVGVLLVSNLGLSGNVLAQQGASVQANPEITNLDQLLNAVRTAQQQERAIGKQREREFLRARNQQKALLEKARREFRLAQKHNNPLQKITEANALELAKLQQQLQTRTREMGDVYSIFNEFSGDISATLQESMTTVEFPARAERLQELASRKKLATIEDMEDLWLLLQEDMTAAAKVKTLQAPVVSVDGLARNSEVVRVGAFTAVSEGEFLRYIPEVGELLALNRQPASRYRDAVAAFENSSAGELQLVTVDPTGGSLLGILSYTPSLRERVEQGGMIGLIILGLGALGVLLTLWRLLYLGVIYLSIRRQHKNLADPQDSNPLGRVILQGREGSLDLNRAGDSVDAMQYKLDEAVLVEVPALERGHNFIKLLAAISPLLGLLGTVTGMILTFQAISLFGSGDPKLMASGISQALVTTVLGLVVAIPLLFGHSLVSSLSRTMIQRLDEQSAGIMAEHLGGGKNINP